MQSLLNFIGVNIRSDDAHLTGVIRFCVTDFIFSRHIVKFHPCSIHSFNNSLGTQNSAIGMFLCQCVQEPLNLCSLIFFSRLSAPACEYLIRMVMSLMVMVMSMTASVFMMTVMATLLIVMMPVMAASVSMPEIFLLSYLQDTEYEFIHMNKFI